MGKTAENKLSQIPLSNDTISSQIDDMSNDILAQVVADLISSPSKFNLQLNETTDVSRLSQLAMFVCYVKDGMIKMMMMWFYVTHSSFFTGLGWCPIVSWDFAGAVSIFLDQMPFLSSTNDFHQD